MAGWQGRGKERERAKGEPEVGEALWGERWLANKQARATMMVVTVVGCGGMALPC